MAASRGLAWKPVQQSSEAGLLPGESIAQWNIGLGPRVDLSMTDVKTPQTTEHVTIYAASWCPFCQNLIAGLKENGTPFEAWDVEKHDDISKWVESVNDGNRVVPTVLYSDGVHATNPSVEEVTAKYAELSGK